MAVGEVAGREAVQGVGHALIEAAPFGLVARLRLVEAMEATGHGPQPVADPMPGDGVELAVDVHHPVFF